MHSRIQCPASLLVQPRLTLAADESQASENTEIERSTRQLSLRYSQNQLRRVFPTILTSNWLRV